MATKKPRYRIIVKHIGEPSPERLAAAAEILMRRIPEEPVIPDGGNHVNLDLLIAALERIKARRTEGEKGIGRDIDGAARA